MIETLHIFRSSAEIPGLYDTLFGGILLTKGLPWVMQMSVVAGYSFSLAFLTLGHSKLSRLSAVLAFMALNLLLLDPWDELFINLQHAFNFAHHGKFSYSALKPVEGTADFLPYFLIGVLGKAGLPIPELGFLFSVGGGLLCCHLGADLLFKLNPHLKKETTFLVLALFAPLVLNSCTGFTATIATAAVLYTIKELFLSSMNWRALLALSLLPLIRFEYLWCTLLFLSYQLIKERKKNFLLLLCFLPTIALVAWRYSYFGTFLPLPILYKSTFSGTLSEIFFYFTLGMRNFVSDLLSCMALPCILSFILLSGKSKEKSVKLFQHLLVLLILFEIPYYLSGGDWFPTAWGRYLLPLSVVSALAFLFALQSFQERVKPYLYLLVGFCLCLQFGSYARLYSGAFTARKTLGDLDYHTDRRTNYRSHYLSQLGNHLNETTPKDVVIASSELSSIMYHAEREVLDTLGLTNPEVISQPLRTPSAILRRIPKDNELPYLIFKRVNQEIIEKHQPQILYTFDFILKALVREAPFQEFDNAALFQAIRRWEERFRGLIDPLYGGVGLILELGYQPVVVMYENQFATLYFVSKEYAPSHFKTLQEKGFKPSVFSSR